VPSADEQPRTAGREEGRRAGKVVAGFAQQQQTGKGSVVRRVVSSKGITYPHVRAVPTAHVARALGRKPSPHSTLELTLR
jgi:hypothetical protein